MKWIDDIDFMDVFFVVLISIFVLLGIIYIFSYINEESRWARTPIFKLRCRLISSNTVVESHSPYYIKAGSSMIPLAGGSSVHDETVWDCGEYGRRKSRNEMVFRYAKEQSVLHFKQLSGELRIVGIER